MKIATWNVNSIRARMDRLLALLGRWQPDALCLQETKVVDELFPVEEIQRAGYRVVFHGQKAYNGVAIVSKEPAQDVTTGFGDRGDDSQARVLAATVGGVRIVNLYVPNGQEVGSEKYAFKLQWFGRLLHYLGAQAHPTRTSLLVCGDFNVAPDDCDVWDPERWRGKLHCSEPEREAVRRLVAWGLVDTFRQHHCEGGHYSWWDYRSLGFPKNRGLRIDYILATRPLSNRCTGAFIERGERKGQGPSDHVPVFAIFDEPAPPIAHTGGLGPAPGATAQKTAKGNTAARAKGKLPKKPVRRGK